ncbi:hypothetical protein [Kitasatospora aureofaciens]|uniref:hypothetical protein n=1 Tax=Kitasatospora aureofaciens TaxID=1894 RepID=UPI001C4675D6|nr:hypothetical protein [Kitasatospora aureofaciens]MBV6702609.1 hypothetical protein [Kitasatospora aureofaciens]
MSDFADYIRRRGWKIEQLGGSIRVLRVLVAHFGIDAPIREADIKAVAALSYNHQGARVVNYLRLRNLLAEDEIVDADLARARRIAAGLPNAFANAVSTWIDVLSGQGSTPSPARTTSTASAPYQWAPAATTTQGSQLPGPRTIRTPGAATARSSRSEP